MANSIDLAKYVARIELDQSGLNQGLDGVDGLVQNRIGGLTNWSKVAIGGLVAGVVAGIGVAIKKGMDDFIIFEEQMNEVYTLLPDISEVAMSQMEQQVRDLSMEVGKLPNEIIPALYQSLSAGVSQDNVFDFLEIASKGAIAGVTDTETMVDGLSSVLNAYQMEASETERISDIMFQTIKNGKTTAKELSDSLYNVIPTASSLGVSFEEVGAGIATITAQGTPTSVATTQMRQMFVELSKEGSKASQIFEELSGQSFKEFIESGGNVQDVLKMMEEHAKNENIAISDLFSSVEAGNAALQLTGGSTELFNNNLEQMGDSAGATEKAFETMDSGIGRSIEKIKTAMADMILGLGETFSPAISKATDFILEAMPKVQNVVESTFVFIGEIIDSFVIVIDWLVANIEQFVMDNEALFNSVKETIMLAFETITVALQYYIEAFKAYWAAYGDNIMYYTQLIWNTISGIFSGTLEIIKGVLNFFISMFRGDWKGMGLAIQQITQGLWDVIKILFESSINYITTIFTLAIETLTSIATAIMTGIHSAFITVWDAIVIWFQEVFEALFTWFAELKETFVSIGSSMFNWVWDGLKGVWSDISSWVSDKVDWIADKLAFWKKAQRAMSSSSSSSSSYYGGSSSYITPQYEVGTPFVPSNQLAFLHEGEAVIPAKYNPFNKNNSLLTQPSNVSNENHYHIDRLVFPGVSDRDEIKEAILGLSTYAMQYSKRFR